MSLVKTGYVAPDILGLFDILAVLHLRMVTQLFRQESSSWRIAFS